MKSSHIIPLLKNDLRVAWAFFPLAIFYANLGSGDFKQDTVYELRPFGDGIILFMLPYLLWNFLFQSSGFYGLKTANASNFSSLEFMFTRAIDRGSLFGVKTGLFLILCALPLVAIWAYSFSVPPVRIELPYSSHQHREEAKQFYLSHFDGAYLQEPDNGRNKDYVVLPHGRIEQTVGAFLFAFAATLLFQVVLFAFARRRWIPLAVFFLLLILSSFASFSRHSPSLYEVSLAWVNQHIFLSLAELITLTAVAQLYCCRRFINTEITS